MTTMTTEETATLPLVRLRATLATGLDAGAEYPYLAVNENAPVGYSGCLILPPGTLAGWAIAAGDHTALRPYVGRQGWWVRESQIEQTLGTAEVPLRTSAAVADDGIPAEHRGDVPDGAYWVTMTRNVDGVPRGREMLAIDDPSGGSRGPLLLIWPGHEFFGFTSSDRPNLPPGWHGWWAHGGAERTRDVGGTSGAEERIVVGSHVTVVADADQPSNNGRSAVVMEMSSGRSPYRVRYPDGTPGGEVGWWVQEVRLNPLAADFPIGHWYSWGSRTDWFRIGTVRADSVTFDRAWAGGDVRERTTTYQRGDLDRHTGTVCLPPGHADMPIPLREQTAADAPATETRTFAEGMRVLLTSRHVMQPGDTGQYREATRGVGFATGVLGRRSEYHDGSWSIQWDHDGGGSVLHESCITPLPTRTPRNGDKVILISDHVTTPGGHVFRESPNGIGSIGRIDTEPDRRDRCGVRWLNDDGSEARHSMVHLSCLAVYPEVEIPTEAEAPTEAVHIDGVPDQYAAAVPENAVWQTHRGGALGNGDFICVPNADYRDRWAALLWPGHPRWVHGTDGRGECPEGWRSFRTNAGWSNLRAVVRERAEVVDVPRVPDEYVAAVPEGAAWIDYTGTSGTLSSVEGRTFLSIPDPVMSGQRLLLFWPGHPLHGRGYSPGRRPGTPTGWAGWRIQSDNAANHRPFVAPAAAVGYEDVPEEYWTAVPEGALKVRHRISGHNEWMAIPYPEGSPHGRMYLLIAWPGRGPLGVPENNQGRLSMGVPEGWTSWAVTLGDRDILGPWPRVGAAAEPTFAVGQVLTIETLRTTRGLVVDRAYNEGQVWVTHGDGSMSRIEGGPSGMALTRMGIGERHPCNPSDQWVTDGWRFVALDESRVPVDEPDAVPGAGTEVERLRAELAEVQRRYDEDLAQIGELMKDEADRRQWCEEYEEVMERINARIHGTLNAARPTAYEVTFSGMVPFSGTIRLDLPTSPTEEQVRDAVRAHFNGSAETLAHYGTVDWSEVDTSDLSAEEWDED